MLPTLHRLTPTHHDPEPFPPAWVVETDTSLRIHDTLCGALRDVGHVMAVQHLRHLTRETR